MTGAEIVAAVQERLATPAPDERRVRQAVMNACADLLVNPRLPGDTWSEQIILRAVALYEGPTFSNREERLR